MPLEFTITYVPVPFVAPTLVVTRNPARRYLIVSINPPTKALALWPESQSLASGFGPPEGTGTVQLFRATLADLIFGDWYAITGVPATLMVIDAWDT